MLSGLKNRVQENDVDRRLTPDGSSRRRSADFSSEGGEMGRLISEFDWSKTAVGAMENWSPALVTVVRVLLASSFPQLLWWSPDYISIYNDAYRPVLGSKHPWGLGRPVRECWSEIWDVLKPLIDTPFHGGPATWMEDIELEVQRSGFTEETHFTVAYSPVPDDAADGGIGGVLATVHEITEKVLSERRTAILRDLGTRASDTKTAEEACKVAASTLSRYTKDIPFSLLYLIDQQGKRAQFAAASGLLEALRNLPVIDLDTEGKVSCSPLLTAHRTGTLQVAEGLCSILDDLPPGSWPDAPGSIVVVPLRSNVLHKYSGFLVVGLSSRLRFDEAYRYFLEVAASQVALAVANAQAYQEERSRAEALAEIDRAKTAFFSNVSHEFRTPLTLMLGPIENLLAKECALAPEDREEILIAHRNSLRLLKLVNSLLDFSRIEAGRIQATYTPVDLAPLTADLASNFRSAIQAAGLELVVDCPPLPEAVYVDREMWEKIMLNLLSNAFKFTLTGRITVSLKPKNGHAILTIADTGTGIPESELPHIFERFHRVEGASGRSYEGTGIGLALIQELVKLHGGVIEASSEIGKGSTFTVAIPFGYGHLPQDHVAQESANPRTTEFRSEAFEGEALSWLTNPTEEAVKPNPDGQMGPRPYILVVDDNADMREHISRILGNGYEVGMAGDGAGALSKVRQRRPDLVLADVMMPVLDGFTLLRTLREDPEYLDMPIILLSARAGMEARTDGINAGADDYLTKPFSAKELIARVETTLGLQRLRRQSAEEVIESEKRFRAFVTATSDVIYRMSADWSEMRFLDGKDFIADTLNPSYGWLERYIHPDDQPQVLGAIQAAIRNRAPFEFEHRVIRLDGSRGWIFSRAVPLLDPQGEIREWFGAARDITAQKMAEERLREAAERFRFMAESMPQKIFATTSDGGTEYFNRQWVEFSGLAMTDIGSAWTRLIHPADLEESLRAWQHSLETGETFQCIHRLRRADGEYRWHLSRALAMRDANDGITMWIGSSTEIHDQKAVEEELRRANQDLEQFAYSASHDLQEPLRGIKIFSELLVSRHRHKLEGDAEVFLDSIRQSAVRMESLLHDLLTYSQVGRLQRPREAVDANEALQAALANLGNALSDSGAKIESETLPVVSFAPAHLQLLFQNLVGNAIKYSRSEVAPVVRIHAKRQDGNWLFAVCDNGIGIEDEFKETIFGLFKRLHTGDEYSGTGMGLAICQRIVERYEGRIWVESTPGEGSNFYFTVPVGTES